VPSDCGKEFSLAAIISIVDQELTTRFGKSERPLPREVNIRRSGCEYVYVEWDTSNSTGGWFGVTIDKDGKVIDFTPGL
jgi:hypothetical protein